MKRLFYIILVAVLLAACSDNLDVAKNDGPNLPDPNEYISFAMTRANKPADDGWMLMPLPGQNNYTVKKDGKDYDVPQNIGIFGYIAADANMSAVETSDKNPNVSPQVFTNDILESYDVKTNGVPPTIWGDGNITDLPKEEAEKRQTEIWAEQAKDFTSAAGEINPTDGTVHFYNGAIETTDGKVIREPDGGQGSDVDVETGAYEFPNGIILYDDGRIVVSREGAEPLTIYLSRYENGIEQYADEISLYFQLYGIEIKSMKVFNIFIQGEDQTQRYQACVELYDKYFKIEYKGIDRTPCLLMLNANGLAKEPNINPDGPTIITDSSIQLTDNIIFHNTGVVELIIPTQEAHVFISFDPQKYPNGILDYQNYGLVIDGQGVITITVASTVESYDNGYTVQIEPSETSEGQKCYLIKYTYSDGRVEEKWMLRADPITGNGGNDGTPGTTSARGFFNHTGTRADAEYDKDGDDYYYGYNQQRWLSRNYMFYGYSPASENVKFNTAEDSGNLGDFLWGKIPSVCTTDYVVAKEEVWRKNADDNTRDLSRIHFDDMQHLLSRVRFYFAIHPDYYKIRRIVVTQVSINFLIGPKDNPIPDPNFRKVYTFSSKRGGDDGQYDASKNTHDKKTWTWTEDPLYVYNPRYNYAFYNTWKDSRPKDMVYYQEGSDKKFGKLLYRLKDNSSATWEDKNLFTDFFIVPSCVANNNAKAYMMEVNVKYNIYDTDDPETEDGVPYYEDEHLVRKCSRQSTITFDEGIAFESGVSHVMKIIINPDYIYTLYDHDEPADMIVK